MCASSVHTHRSESVRALGLSGYDSGSVRCAAPRTQYCFRYQNANISERIIVYFDMDWTSKKIIKFISEIETRPVLWDTSHINYKNGNVRYDASIELASIFDCDSAEVFRKWKIILAQYRREKKKIFESKTLGSGTFGTYKPKWFGYKHLSFLYGWDDPTDNFTPDADLDQEMKPDMTLFKAYGSQENPKNTKFPQYVPKFYEENKSISTPQDSVQMGDSPDKKFVQKFQDDHEIFAAGIASKLRKIENEKTKILVQRDIDNLLYDAIIGIGKYDSTLIPSSHFYK